MDSEHINRISSLIEDDHSFLTDPIWIKQLHSVRTTAARTKWKWFFRDIGKHSCIMGLLPFLEVAKHLRHTPLIENTYPAREHDSDEIFHTKLTLISEWVNNPSKVNKQKLINILTPAHHALKYDLFIGGSSPNEKST